MKSSRSIRSLIPLAAFVLGSACSTTFAGGCDSDGDAVVPDQIVLRLVPGASIDDVLADYAVEFPGLLPIESIPGIHAWLVQVPEPLCEKDAIDAIEDDARVLEATFNDVEESGEGQTQSFYFVSTQPAFLNQYSWSLLGLDSAHAFATGSGVRVAVLDSGVDASHPVFATSVVLPGISLVAGSPTVADVGDGIDNDGDGQIDESVGHGTHIAGVVAFVAPGAEILPIRVLDSDGFTNVFALSAAIAIAVEAGAEVVNVSIVSPEGGGILDDAVTYAQSFGAIIVAASGNFSDSSLQYPAALPGVVAVAATDALDQKASFSVFGPHVTISAPGVSVVGPLPGGFYGGWSGTSMSTALVSGSLGLVREIETSSVAALDRLLATATNIDSVNRNYVGLLGSGRVDAAAATVTPLPEDLNGDGLVTSADLAILLGLWGPCSACAADLDGSGAVDGGDIAALLSAWS